MRVATALVLLFVLGVGGSACDDGATAEVVCSHVCACQHPSPTAQDQCQTECVGGLAGVSLPNSCLDCVVLTECGNSEELEGACASECNGLRRFEMERKSE